MIKNIVKNNNEIKHNTKELEVLKDNFPSCFKNDGSFDLEQFKYYLQDKVSITNEGYELNFLGKSYSRLLASVDTTTVIKPKLKHNLLDLNKNSNNIFITGDNLDGLKHLLKSYSDKIKCIYIDPPYNTGSDNFVYRDNFNFTIESLSEKLSISEDHAERILDMTNKGSASHSAWLMFMYPRLMLARDILSKNGVIFISIDDNENHNLKLICDDIFGEENFISEFIWERKNKPSFLNVNLGTKTEYILAYGKNRILAGPLSVDTTEVGKKYPFNNSGNGVKKLVFPKKSVKFTGIQNEIIEPQDMSEGNIITELLTKLIIEDGYNSNEFVLNGEWRYSQETLDDLVASNEEITINKVPFRPNLIKKGGEVKKIHNLLTKSLYNMSTNEDATEEQIKLFGKDYFDYVKPLELIKFFIKSCTYDEKDSYILDFFSGSSTTAHATMELNAEDGGNRKFIMIQLPEQINSDKPAFQDGYRTVDEIGSDRIIKASSNMRSKYLNLDNDLGFKHFELVNPTNKMLDKIDEFNPDELSFFVDNNLLEEFGIETVLKTWLVSDGYGLTTEPEKLSFSGYNGYFMDKHLYLLDTGIQDSSIEDILIKYETEGDFNPENIILFGYSFTWTEIEQLKVNLKRLKDTDKNLSINFEVRY